MKASNPKQLAWEQAISKYNKKFNLYRRIFKK